MMFKKLMSITALAAVTATAASAQIAAKPISFGGFAGAAIPTGKLSDGVNTGFTGGLSLGLFVPTLPVSFRIDGTYNQFGAKDKDSGDGNIHYTSFTGNVVYNLPLPNVVQPYVIGGIGMYNAKATGADSENAFGFNVGAGIKLPLSGFNTFVEARYNRAEKNGNAISYVPIVFGVMF